MSKETIKTYRQKRKTDLIYIMGGKCQICGYNKCEAALEFHHCNSNEKDFNLSNGNCRSLEKDLREARKCILLCANCHREVEYNNLKLNPVFDEEKAKEVIERNSIKKIYCVDCGEKITSGAIRCEECSQKARRKVERPSREELKKLMSVYSLIQFITERAKGNDMAITSSFLSMVGINGIIYSEENKERALIFDAKNKIIVKKMNSAVLENSKFTEE